MMKTPHEKLFQKAIALKYDQTQDKAPIIVAKGSGLVAERIVETARASSVPIYQNQTLSNLLMAVEIDQEIPTELYTAVAEVLSYIYRIDQVKGKGRA